MKLIKKIFIFALAAITSLTVVPVQAGSDTFAGLFSQAATVSQKVTSSVASVAPALVPVAAAGVPAVATASTIATTSIPAAVGIGLGCSLAAPIAGAFLGILYGLWESKDVNGKGWFGENALQYGFGAGIVCSPFIAAALTTGMVPGLVAISSAVALKSAVAGCIYASVPDESKEQKKKDYLPYVFTTALSGLAAALWCGYSR